MQISGVLLVGWILGCPLPPEESSPGGQNQAREQGKAPVGAQKGGGSGAANGGGPGGAPGGGPSGGAANAGGGNANAGGGNANAGGGPNGGSGGPGGAGGGGAANAGGGPGGVLLDMTQMSAQKSQEELASVDHVSISGVVKGSCAGLVRVDVLDTSNLGGPKDGVEIAGPITTLDMNATGEFTILVPKDSSVSLTALCDADKNKKITSDADQLSLGSRLGQVSSDKSGIELVLEEIKPPNKGQKEE